MKDRNKNSEEGSRTIVTHGTGVYDVTTFADIHPGGRSYFDAFNKKVEVDLLFHGTHVILHMICCAT